MTQVGYGPLWRIDGPPPVRPPYGLLQAADAPAAGVNLLTDTDAADVERWVGGVEVYPYPPGPADVFNTCQPGSDTEVKNEGDSTPTSPFGAMTVYLGGNCTAYRVWDQDEWKRRIELAFEAVEGAAVAKEFLTGGDLSLNPHLADGQGTFPNLDTATSVKNGVALLDAEIAKSGKLGLIHMPPQVLTALAGLGLGAADNKTGVWRTPNGNVIVPDAGYVDGANPSGHAAATGTKEWIYATGPVDVRRSAVFFTPDDVREALDRSTNKIVYRAERYYLVDWDTEVQAAVLIDRCQDTC
jgi:hypothetical protein